MLPMTLTADVLDMRRPRLDHAVTSQSTVADLAQDTSRLHHASAENIAATAIETAGTVAILLPLLHTPQILDGVAAIRLALATVTAVATTFSHEIHTTAIARPDEFQPTNTKLLEALEEAP